MARTKERLYLRFRTPNGKQSPYCPALYDKKSRIRPGWCLVRGVEEHGEKSLWRFFLGTGFRESEAAVAEKTDINHDTKSIKEDEKPWCGFQAERLREAVGAYI